MKREDREESCKIRCKEVNGEMTIQTFGHNLIVDIHGMTVSEASRELIQLISRCDMKTHEIEVIHGFHGGTALKEMVRSLKHPRVEKRILSLNQGSTTIVLKSPSAMNTEGSTKKKKSKKE